MADLQALCSVSRVNCVPCEGEHECYAVSVIRLQWAARRRQHSGSGHALMRADRRDRKKMSQQSCENKQLHMRNPSCERLLSNSEKRATSSKHLLLSCTENRKPYEFDGMSASEWLDCRDELKSQIWMCSIRDPIKALSNERSTSCTRLLLA
ncbi:hypothetical protein QQF64_010683 [Cirrhinus molitorella]|uniref:Uncharacterized protein n=1 Tax=Cirrhinus molitorella TaxID=172907 RepID=A0ABR3M063_9TELE